MNELRFIDIRNNQEINAYIASGNAVLGALGYTDHSQAHAGKAANNAGMILRELCYDEKTIELAQIAGYMHDIGNTINRTDHAHSGALMARQILKELGMHYDDIAIITSAIGHHDEKTGTAVHPVSAALILADKSDVHRNRVRNTVKENFDIHDRVNYAAIRSVLSVDREHAVIQLDITLDEAICSVLDYFEIFLQRMIMCRRAAEILECKFKLTANDVKII
ncbi:MAG: HD domain-containing protein [Clostridiales bacterium]|nr:HD domain-containing protein [Clostridiales bacterium]